MKIKKRLRLPIRWKLASTILFAAIVPIIIIGITFFPRLSDMIVADTIRNAQTTSAKRAPLVSEQIQKVEGYLENITNMAFYQDIFYEPLNGDLSSLVTDSDASLFAAEIDELIQDTELTNVRIYLELPEECGFFDSEYTGNVFAPLRTVSANYWYGILNNSKTATLYCPEFYLGVSEREDLGNCALIFRTSINYEGEIYKAFVALYHDKEIFQSLLSTNLSVEGGGTYLITNRDAIVAASDDQLAGMYRIRYDKIMELLRSSNSFVEQVVVGESVDVAAYYIEETGWYMVTFMPEEPLKELANNQISRFFFWSFLVILIGIVVAILISNSLTRRLSVLSEKMENVKYGPPEEMEETRENDEVGDLISTYNYMVREINSLVEQQTKSAEELRRAEFDSLQAQINPHFLYNTMDMINWMTLQGRNEEASEVIQMLARFYKLTLSRKKDYSNIEDELEHANIYVNLMNMRYDNVIDFVVDVPEEFYDCRIPKLTLQPILENSILHGILEKDDRTGTIVITAWEEDGDIVILVSDDGVGIDPELIPNILKERSRQHAKGSNIAIYNIHNRLKLLNGEAYGLSYDSELGKGCEVSIRIPKIIDD